MMNKSMKVTLAAIGVAVLVAAVGVIWWATKDSAEPEFELSSTATTARTTGTTAAPDAPAGAATWKVGAGSEAGYRIDEKLRGLSNTATPRTEDVSGQLTLDGASVSDAEFVVKLETLTSDDDMRDRRVSDDYLQTAEFPEATFTLTGPLELSGAPEVGTPVTVDAKGSLELHGVTNDITVPVEAQLTAADTLELIGSTTVALADYEIEAPDIAGIVTSAPEGKLEFKLVLTPA